MRLLVTTPCAAQAQATIGTTCTNMQDSLEPHAAQENNVLSSAASFFSPSYRQEDRRTVKHEIYHKMSGFEVVGLVLAIYPMLIDGIRTYQKLRSGQLLADLLKDVLEEQIVFHNWIGHLLMRSVPAQELRDLLDHNSAAFARWHDHRLHQIIEQSYGRVQASFLLETLADVHGELERIKGDLSTLKSSAVCQHPHFHVSRLTKYQNNIRTKLTTALRSARHAREGSHMRECLVRLSKLNRRLGNVCTTSRFARQPMPLLSNIAPVKFELDLTDHARGVHQALQGGYRCRCFAPHLTKFCLPYVAGERFEVSQKSPRFEVLFSVDAEEESLPQQSPQLIEDAELSTSLADLSITASQWGSQSQSPSASVSTLTRRDSIFSKINSNVSTNSSTVKLPPSESCSLILAPSQLTDEDLIMDVCDAVKRCAVQLNGGNSCLLLGQLTSRDRVAYDLRSLPAAEATVTPMKSLEDIFGDHRLNRKHRIALAFRLSAAIIQFFSTPWIRHRWSWEDFSILGFSDWPIDQVRLYVTHQFWSTQNDQVQRAAASSSVLSIIPGEQALIRLGCALVELAFGQRLASMHGGTINSAESDVKNLMIVHALVESGKLRDEEGKIYHNVVRTCLKQEIPQDQGWKSLNRNDPSFFADATRAIVQPLRRLWMEEWGPSGLEEAY